jgi:hypothetical protein
VYNWWKSTFPYTPVNYINAGIGATDSYIGVHRADRDVIACSPDVIIVEFSVNDTDEFLNPRTYDSLLRKLLVSGKSPAVILLFTVMQDGKSMQDEHMKLGTLYGLPMISYKNAVFPEIESGSLRWEDISSDDVHPSSAGHSIISQLVISYLESVYSLIPEKVRFSISDKPSPYGDIYSNALLMDSTNIKPVCCDGFEMSSVSSQFPHGWTTGSGGVLEFVVTARNIGIMYHRTTDGHSGVYSVLVDGAEKIHLDGDFSGGWGDYADYKEVYISDAPAVHRITLMPAEGLEKKIFTVLGLGIS